MKIIRDYLFLTFLVMPYIVLSLLLSRYCKELWFAILTTSLLIVGLISPIIGSLIKDKEDDEE